jgi:aerobic carbon-monoxide dehydrogenase small subunit
MRKISLTVNGERCEAEVEPRTQVAALLRDRLHLTGTHVGCEQGVCGACTILVDGKPIRSCITYALAVDGAVIETIEGFQSDPVMAALRRAFSEHHALQCGYCTPGMIIVARDIVLRLGDPDEEQIRFELSGNLCRCTGYVGIVRAIAAVIRQGDSSKRAPPRAAAPAARAPLRPFALSQDSLGSARSQAPQTSSAATVKDGWTSIERLIILTHPPAEVWALFSDIERVARCIPGASVRSASDDSFEGALTVKFGPIAAAFEGAGERSIDARDNSGVIRAAGKDASGQSKARGQLTYRLSAASNGAQTAVDLSLRFQIKGLLAQFNRPDLVEGFADVLLLEFAAGCEATLAGKAPGEARTLSGFGLTIAVVKRALRRRFSRPRST